MLHSHITEVKVCFELFSFFDILFSSFPLPFLFFSFFSPLLLFLLNKSTPSYFEFQIFRVSLLLIQVSFYLHLLRLVEFLWYTCISLPKLL